LLGFQGGLTSGSVGGLCSGQGSSVLSFKSVKTLGNQRVAPLPLNSGP
jgi:hypothetical protein